MKRRRKVEKKEGTEEWAKEERRKEGTPRKESASKDAMGWTVVTRNKRQRMVQIFVKVHEAKVTSMEASLTDGKVEDVMRQIQKDEDVYVTMHGTVLRRNETL